MGERRNDGDRADEQRGMGIRAVVPLPGPFAFVSKSRAEKIVERDDRARRRAAMTTSEVQRRGMVLVGLFWLLAVSWAGHYFGALLALVVAVVGVAHLVKCHRVGKARQDEEMAAALARARDSELLRDV